MSEASVDMLTASQMLKQARESMGLSQDEVAQELFLTPAYIRQIDNDEIDKIAKQAFVRGYLRSYAKMVQLDGDEVVARFEKSRGTTPQKIEIRGVTQEPVGSTNFTGPVFQTGILGLIGLVVVIALVWFLSSSSEQEVANSPVVEESVDRPQTSVPEEVVTLPDEIESSSLPDISENQAANEVTEPEIEIEEPAQALVNAVVDSIEAEAASSDVDNVDNAPTEAAASLGEIVTGKQIAVQRSGDIVRVNAGGDDELRFSFSAECWIEIEDGQGEAIYGDLNRSGDELIVTGQAPFEILFGKAPAVRMEYNGNPFDLAPHTTSVETAKVTVGN